MPTSHVQPDTGCIGPVQRHFIHDCGETLTFTKIRTNLVLFLPVRAARNYPGYTRTSSTAGMSSTSSLRSTIEQNIALSVDPTTYPVLVTSATSSIPVTSTTSSTSDKAGPIAWAGSIEPSETPYCWSIIQFTSTSNGEIVRVSQTSTHVPCPSTSSNITSTSSTSPPITLTSSQESIITYTPHPPAHDPAFFLYISVGAGAGIVLLTVVACLLWWYRVGRLREPFRKNKKIRGGMEEFSGGDLGSMSEVPTDPQVKSQIEELQLGQERIVQLVQAQLLEKVPNLDGITFRDWNQKVEEQHEIDEKKAEEARLAAIGGAYASTSRRIANAVVQQRIARGMAASISQTGERQDGNGTQLLLRSEIGDGENLTLVPGDSASAIDWITSGQYEEKNTLFDRSPRDPRLMKAAYANMHELENPEQFEDLVDEAVRWADQEHQQQTVITQSQDSERLDPQHHEDLSASSRRQHRSPFQASIPGPSTESKTASADSYHEQRRDPSRSRTPRANYSSTERFIYTSPTGHSPDESSRYRSRSRSRTPTLRANVPTPGPSRILPRPLLSPLQTGLANNCYNVQPAIRTSSDIATSKRPSSLKRHHEVHTSTSDLVGPDGGIERHTTTTTYTREPTPVQEGLLDDDVSSIGAVQFARSELSYPYSRNESRLTIDPFEAEVKQNLTQIRLEKEKAAEQGRSQEQERARWRRERDNLPPE